MCSTCIFQSVQWTRETTHENLRASQLNLCSTTMRGLFSKERFSHRSHGTTAQHTELLVFLCCSFPQTTLCIHFHLHKSVPCSSSVVSPFQLLLPPAHILARITIPQNTLVNSLGKPEVKSCIRFAQDKTWLLVKCLLVTSPASLLRDG